MIVKGVVFLKTPSGNVPMEDWLNSLDKPTKQRIKKRIRRIQMGNLGDWKRVGGKIYELRMTFGAGYRIYYTLTSNGTIVLLCGSNKSRQQRDIEMAKKYSKDIEEGSYYEV